MSGKVTTIILAAGKGTRMKSTVPKVLHKVCGVPMIKRVVDAALGVNSGEVVVILRHEKELIEAFLQQTYPHLLNVKVAYQGELPGTGAAVLDALPTVSADAENIAILSGDVPLFSTEHLAPLLTQFETSSADLLVLGTHVADPTGYGRIITTESAFIVEEKDATSEQRSVNFINTGIYIAKKDLLQDILPKLQNNNASGEVYLTDIVKHASTMGKNVVVADLPQSIYAEGVNDRSQLAHLSGHRNAEILQKHMRAGVTIIDPTNTWIGEDVEIAPDVLIEPGCYIYGKVRIESGAQILLSTRIIAGCGDDKSIVIGKNASIGPFAYLREGNKLAENTKIGAFVEAKKAKIGRGSKVPHLTYIGDAEVGEGSNIGAGSIFANYDGVHKHATKVGNNVRIGSKSVLVAPVEVGDNSYTGAGTLVRKDIPADVLAYSKNELVVNRDWIKENR
jgi:bifunctional UDP-N-acetylglucosamine pyrophosphorylase/glucosamine-1-phosphate N-acetyltransferase